MFPQTIFGDSSFRDSSFLEKPSKAQVNPAITPTRGEFAVKPNFKPALKLVFRLNR